MFFIDGEKHPSINGTGSEDYFLGGGFWGPSFFIRPIWAPVKGSEFAGSRSSVYRFHLDSPIPFTKSLKATIEHGHANHRSDNFFSVAYLVPRKNLTRHFPHCLQLKIAFLAFMPSEVPGMLQSDMRMSRTRILSISLTVSFCPRQVGGPMRSQISLRRPVRSVVDTFEGTAASAVLCQDLISRGAVPILDQINYRRRTLPIIMYRSGPGSDLTYSFTSRQQRGWHWRIRSGMPAQRKLPSTTGTERLYPRIKVLISIEARGCVRPKPRNPKSQCFSSPPAFNNSFKAGLRWSRSAEFVRRHRC